jgi:protocatechuate 3,4-dioxygenase beta subunit
MVYFEPAAGEDSQPNVFHLTFHGGAPGTQLVELLINTDKTGDGLSIGDTFFDTTPAGAHAFGWSPFQIVHSQGIDRVEAEVQDGGTLLRLRFEGFDAGDLLVFTIDVDEMGFLGANAVAEGNEFEGSILTARFEAPHYYPSIDSVRFFDAYDPLLAASSLPLPPDSYTPPSEIPQPVNTAGAFLTVEQRPLPSTLEGRVFEDVNLDTRWDPAEPPLAGVVLQLWKLEEGGYQPTDLTAVTDQTGRYLFDMLPPGTYRVVQMQPAGYFSVAALQGRVEGNPAGQVVDTNTIDSVQLLGGQRADGYDFAEARPANLTGGVFHDANDNGIWDAHEAGIGGVSIIAEYSGPLSSDQGPTRVEVLTQPDGTFVFVGLLPGTWSIRQVQPKDYLDGKDRPGSAGGTLTPEGDTIAGIWLGSGQTGRDYWFGELLPSRLCGMVYADQNGDWTLDPGEHPLAGVTIWLLNQYGERIANTATDAEGRFCFRNLPPGVYGLEQVQPTGYFDGGVLVGSAGGSIVAQDRIEGILLTSGTQGQNYVFREWEPASISGFVFEDDNNNGRRDPGEKGIAGARILLLDEAGQPTGREALTDASGAYRFEELAPNRRYGIQEIQPTGYFDGRDSLGTAGGRLDDSADRVMDIFLRPAQAGREYNFGELRPASLEGLVFADRNSNLVLDSGEKPLAGVTIYLFDSQSRLVSTTTSDAQGRWQFDHLLPGVYSVVEVQPEGYFDGPEVIGSAGGWSPANDQIVGIKLPPGVHATSYQFIEWEPARISGYVFQDGPPILVFPGEELPSLNSNRTGHRGPQAIPIAGVVLRLADERGQPILDAQGNPVIAVTNAEGYYEFKNLPPGFYSIYQEHPEGFIDWLDSPGTNGGLAVNPGQPLDPTILGELTTDPRNDAILRIPLHPGDEATEYNFSELSLSPLPVPLEEPPPSPPLPVAPSIIPAEFSRRPLPVLGTSEVPLHFGAGAGMQGGGLRVEEWSWHLSVINAGQPRQTPQVGSPLREVSGGLDAVHWSQGKLHQGVWIIVSSETGQILFEATLGSSDGLPVVGDFNGDGRAEIGVFVNGSWFIDLNGNGTWDEGDLWVQLGQPGDQPVTGDWDNDGKTDIGTYGPAWPGDPEAAARDPGLPDVANRLEGPPKNLPPTPPSRTAAVRAMRLTSRGPLRADVIDHVFFFGGTQAIAVAGDWNGDGVTNIGLFAEGRWILDVDGDGQLTANDLVIERFGQAGDLPIVGDWNGDGIDDLGVFRAGTFLLDSDGDRRFAAGDRQLKAGQTGDRPVAGDFDGDGKIDVGIYRPSVTSKEQVASQPANARSAASPPSRF